MKPITNALLIAAIICYIFFPFYNIAFEGDWTGLKYTAEVISNSDSLSSLTFVLIPFVACFGGILFNCLKHRLWGIATALCIIAGLYFYHVAYEFTGMENPQIFSIEGIGTAFNIGYALLIAALGSTIVSLLPFNFNKKQ